MTNMTPKKNSGLWLVTGTDSVPQYLVEDR